MIVIVGSRKFSNEILELTLFLQKKGIDIVSAPYPDIEYNSTLISKWADKGLVYDHLYKLQKATSCFIYNPNGYVGVNTVFEIGYFLQSNKPIYACYETNETCIDMFVSEFINSNDKNKIFKKLS